MRMIWSDIPSTTTLGWFLRLPLRLLPRSSFVRVRTGLNKGMKWIVGSSTHGCWLGTYEHDKQRVLTRFIKPGMTVFDVGANAGFYTLAFARLVGSQGQVCAFEPLANKADCLLKHIGINRLTNVTVVQAAIDERHGIASLHVEEDGSMSSVSDSAPYKVPVVSLDELCDAGVVPYPDVIKMDIEGSESLALEGSRLLLGKGRTVWFIALHGAEQRQQCQEIFRSSQYRIFHLDGHEHRGQVLDDDEIYAVPAALIS